MKIIFIMLVLIGVIYGDGNDLKIIDSIVQEPSCLQEGGACAIAADCPRELLAERGLCPQQQKRGVECCYGISIKETRCGKHGGTCLPKEMFCNERVVYHKATDCTPLQKCCFML